MKFIIIFFLLLFPIFGQEFRKIYLFGEIGDDNSKEIITAILDNDKKPILIFINSPGGDVDSGIAIINAMYWSKKEIYTIALGGVYSMAFHIFICGKGRYALPNSLFMIHDAKYDFSGYNSLTDIEDLLIIEKKIQKNLNEDIFKKTKIPKKIINSYLKRKRDLYLTPEDGLKYQFIDDIFEFEEDLILKIKKDR